MRAMQAVTKARGRNVANGDRLKTKHEWNDMGDGDGRNRPQMAGDASNDSRALTGDDITKYRALVAHKTDQISSSRQCRYVVRWQDHPFVTWIVSKIPRWEAASRVLVPLAAEL